MTSLKIYLQQSHKFQDFSHSDKSAMKQATLENAQSHKHKGTRQNKFWDKTQQCQSNFLIFYFYVIFGFLIHKKKKIDQKQKLTKSMHK